MMNYKNMTLPRRKILDLNIFLIVIVLFAGKITGQAPNFDKKLDSIISLMTLEEKAGQMNQFSADFPTGPITPQGDVQNQIKAGMVGSFLNASGANRTRELQELAMKSRMKIPLLFGQDILHGYRTVFPIPLAEACSWDLPLISLSARYAAIEATAVGLHWVFAPMIDVTRDPRWGRVMEAAGEDPYLGAKIATARVKGFQGDHLGQVNAVMACAKHFAAYGAAVGGRDYNSVDISRRQLHDLYLPPFLAAKEAGCATFMNSFNDINGIPATHIFNEPY
jgi:beta-glucosidase